MNICAYTISLHKMEILPAIIIYESDWKKCNIYQALSKLEIKINTDYHLIHYHQDI